MLSYSERGRGSSQKKSNGAVRISNRNSVALVRNCATLLGSQLRVSKIHLRWKPYFLQYYYCMSNFSCNKYQFKRLFTVYSDIRTNLGLNHLFEKACLFCMLFLFTLYLIKMKAKKNIFFKFSISVHKYICTYFVQ